MTTELKELINKLNKVTPQEYGKLWKEYAKVYEKLPTVKRNDYDMFDGTLKLGGH